MPAGALLGIGVVAGYLFALHDLDLPLGPARTVAVTVLIAGGLYLVLALEAEGSWRRSTLVATMCAVLAGTALVAAALTILALMLAGFTIQLGPRRANRRG